MQRFARRRALSPDKPAPMKTFPHTLPLVALALGLSACAPIHALQDEGVRLDESHLRDAGFKLMLADRQDRQDMLNALPADTLTRIGREDGDYYIYPDPDGCVCLYVGRESEYQALQRLAAQRQIADQQLMYNDIKANSQNGWGYAGPWGGWANNNPGRPSWDPH
jgi:hypothetical protein